MNLDANALTISKRVNKMKNIFRFTCIVTLLGVTSCKKDNTEKKDEIPHQINVANGPDITDIDGNVYPTVIIGTQHWTAANLKTTRYSNGDTIPEVPDKDEWKLLIFGAPHFDHGAWCYYDNDLANNEEFGKLYNWHATGDARNICPNGWHVPSDEEWHQLVKHLDPKAKIDSTTLGIRVRTFGTESEIAGGYLKALGTFEKGDGKWESPNAEANNKTNFNALPYGARFINQDDPVFNEKGKRAAFWSSTKYELFDGISSIYRLLNYDKGNIEQRQINNRVGLSVRCIKD